MRRMTFNLVSVWSLKVMNINARLRTLYKMYLCKHERDHVLGYLVMEERKKERENSIQVDTVLILL